MKKSITILGIIVLLSTSISCTFLDKKNEALPSWNEGTAKEAIISYVNEVTNIKSKRFIPIAYRIATFDNDGNL